MLSSFPKAYISHIAAPDRGTSSNLEGYLRTSTPLNEDASALTHFGSICTQKSEILHQPITSEEIRSALNGLRTLLPQVRMALKIKKLGNFPVGTGIWSELVKQYFSPRTEIYPVPRITGQ